MAALNALGAPNALEGGAASVPLLALDSLRLSIAGRAVLEGVSLQVGAGEIVGLVGASGSGKSLTALAVLGLLPPHSLATGRRLLNGRALDSLTQAQWRAMRGRDVAMVFQDPMSALNPMLHIGDQVAETVRLHERISRAAATARAREALAAVGLGGEGRLLERHPHELSGGQRQRVAIAMAVVMGPALLIADEPTTALDVITQAQVLALLRALVRERGMGLLFISHDMAVVGSIADRIAVMQGGRIVEEGTTGQALKNLRHPYSRALFAAARLPDMPASAPLPAPGSVRAVGPLPVPVVVPTLQVQGVVREYARARRSFGARPPAFRAVDQVSMTLAAGETIGLVGESGSGKSSLLRVLLALDRPQAGRVMILGESFTDARGARLRALRRGVQAVFQDPYGSFDPRWTVGRLIAEPAYLLDAPLTAGEQERRVARLLEEVGLSPDDARRYPRDFSGGQRQRIAIARALMTEPALLILDEAVSALDVLVRGQILDLLREVTRRSQLACVFASHDLQVVAALAARVYVMQRGRIVEHGPTATVFGSPQHPYTQALLAAMPRLDVS